MEISLLIGSRAKKWTGFRWEFLIWSQALTEQSPRGRTSGWRDLQKQPSTPVQCTRKTHRAQRISPNLSLGQTFCIVTHTRFNCNRRFITTLHFTSITPVLHVHGTRTSLQCFKLVIRVDQDKRALRSSVCISAQFQIQTWSIPQRFIWLGLDKCHISPTILVALHNPPKKRPDNA